MVRTAEEFEPLFPMSSKTVSKCTSDEILRVVLNVLNKFDVSINQCLMFMIDGAANMFSLGRCLKEHSAKLLHITCKIHALKGGLSKDLLSCHKPYFKFANITSLDVKRSFSLLKNIYFTRHTHLTARSGET